LQLVVSACCAEKNRSAVGSGKVGNWPEGEEALECCAGLLSGADRILGLGILDRRF
jgi:hypothetical protein